MHAHRLIMYIPFQEIFKKLYSYMHATPDDG